MRSRLRSPERRLDVPPGVVAVVADGRLVDRRRLDLEPQIEHLAELPLRRRHVAAVVDLGDEPRHDPLRLALGAAHGALDVALRPELVTADVARGRASEPEPRCWMLPCMEPPEVGPSGHSGWPMDGQVGSLQASEAAGQRPDQDFFSALGGIRTPNLLIRSQMLYPLSYERPGASLGPPPPPVSRVRGPPLRPRR